MARHFSGRRFVSLFAGFILLATCVHLSSKSGCNCPVTNDKAEGPNVPPSKSRQVNLDILPTRSVHEPRYRIDTLRNSTWTRRWSGRDLIAGKVPPTSSYNSRKNISSGVCPFCTVYDVYRPTTDTSPCVKLSMVPPALICIHSDIEDQYVSKNLRIHGMWERELFVQLQATLRRNDSLGLIDIGANLGLYSLAAAAMGRQAVSVEPLSDNVRHLHKAIRLNHFQHKITVIQNAISNSRETVRFKTYKGNKGGTSMYAGRKACKGVECPTARSIIMDDMVPLMRELGIKGAVMKLDIEGAEHLALANASAMFEAVFIPYVFMEIEIQKRLCDPSRPPSSDKTLVDRMFRFFADHHYTRVYDSVKRILLDQTQCSAKWPRDIVWVHHSQRYPA